MNAAAAPILGRLVEESVKAHVEKTLKRAVCRARSRAEMASAALKLIALFCVAGFSLLGCVEAATSNATAPINSSFFIPLADYELQTTLIDIFASPNSTFKLQFGNLPGQSNPHSLGILHSASSQLVWFTYRDHNPGLYDNLGGTSASLQLQSDGDLVISVDGDGTDVLVWHTSTSNRGVRSMELSDNGNLVLLNSSNGIVWQSFDHPADTLLSTQKLLVGSSLLVSATNKYPFQGWNVLAMEANRLVSYVMYNDSEPYWELKAPDDTTDLAYAAIANASISIFDKNGNLVASRGNASSGRGEGIPNLQRFVLGIDGNMKLFEYDNTTQQWVPQMQVIVEACALPDDCGYYGVCIPGQGCSCPPDFQQIVTINGCVPPRTLVCNSRHGNDFVRIAAASYFATNVSKGATDIPLKECQDKCTSNCSCLGFFYGAAEGSTAKGKCLITNQMRTLTASVYGNYSDNYMYDAYVRVQGKPRSPLAIILGVCIPVVVIISCLVLWWFITHKVKVAHAEEEEFLLGALPGLPPRYSYRELKIATNNFSHKMGGGSFGSVYEGVLGDKSKIAVKRLEGIVQGKKEFHAEVATIGTVRHLNLVRLRGFCLERNHRLLVYEHMGRGSLDALLFPTENSLFEKPLWADRLTIAIGVAKGLAYLHEGCPECIIHCDIKPENILVGDDGAAKLSDFGLAKLQSRELSFVETNVRGTRGYMAPEWLRSHGRITEKADVFSFGVVLLELLSGRRNYEAKAGSSMGYLPDWALRNLTSGGEGNTAEILDNQIIADTDPAAKSALMVALWCLQEDPTMRPTMGHVVRMLEGDMEVPPAPPPPPPSDTSSSEVSPRAFEVDRFANSEITVPFFRRASHFFFSSSTASSTSAPNTVASSLY